MAMAKGSPGPGKGSVCVALASWFYLQRPAALSKYSSDRLDVVLGPCKELFMALKQAFKACIKALQGLKEGFAVQLAHEGLNETPSRSLKRILRASIIRPLRA